jgi:predicted metal-dependent HD superfamily phosphohydrolase
MLKELFTDLAGQYTRNSELTGSLWNEIEQAYTGRSRAYHTMEHLAHLYRELSAVTGLMDDPHAVWFAVCYHDIVYDASAPDNEEQSAAVAAERLRQLSLPEERSSRCIRHILATKGHSAQQDPDTRLFTDADLSILGQPPVQYRLYAENIRQEYAIYPDEQYKPGRKKVLKHFLYMDKIFSTGHFRSRYETQARQNLQDELRTLMS